MTPKQRAALASRYQTDGMVASSPQKLVVLMFERIGEDLAKAVEAIEASRVEEAHRALLNAQDIIFELQVALDDSVWEGAADLRSIYDYLLGLLVEANTKKSVEHVQRCSKIVNPLIETWTEAYRRVQSGEAALPKPAVPVAAK